MKKTIHVEIADVDFILNGDAYDLLKDYLDELEILFAGLDERDEIIADIESRVAEKLCSHQKKNNVISHDQIHQILSDMGRPEDIYEVLGEFDLEGSANAKPKLYRDSENAILGGVCSGIGAYFGTDPVIVRLFFIAFTALGGAGLLIYIILWVIVPKADTAIKKRQMYGTKNVLHRIDRGLNQLADKLQLKKVSRKIESSVAKKPFKRKKSPTTKKKASTKKEG